MFGVWKRKTSDCLDCCFYFISISLGRSGLLPCSRSTPLTSCLYPTLHCGARQRRDKGNKAKGEVKRKVGRVERKDALRPVNPA